MSDKEFGLDSIIETGNVVKEELLKMFEELLSELRPTMGINDLHRVYAKSIDNVILNEEDKSGHKYVGGEFKIDLVGDKHYVCSYRLFFQDDEKKIFELSAKSKELLLSNLSEEFIAELKKNDDSIKFEIPDPLESVRREHDRKHFETTH